MRPLEAAPRPGDRRRALAAFAVLAVGLVVGTLLAPSAAVPLRFVAALWAAAAIGYGVRCYQPQHRSVWYLLIGAIVSFQISDFGDLHHQHLSPRWSDWLAFAGYPLAAVALSGMVRLRSAGRDAAGFLDAAVGTAALLVPTWVFLVAPFVRGEYWSATRLEAILPPIGDVMLLGILLRLLAAPAARSVSLWLLASGVVVTAFCDVGEALNQLGAVPWFGSPAGVRVIEMGWLAFNLLWGASALSPDMRWNTEPTPTPRTVVMPARIMALTLAALAEPAVAAVLLAQSEYSLGVFGPILESTIIVLIMVRVSLVLADHRRALRSERILVSASGPLAAAATVEETAEVLTATAARLAGPKVPHRIAAVVEDPKAAGKGPAPDSGFTWGLVPAADLPPKLATTLRDFDHALVFPLGTESENEDVWAAGLLAVGAPERALLDLAAPLEILTGQAALSLNRLALGVEIARRDGERYFQALVQNDSDAILIVDTAARVRYASPSAEAMFRPAALLGRPVSDLLGPVHAQQLADLLAAPARHAPQRRDWVLDTDGGLPREVEATVSDLRDEPTVAGLVLSLRDVTTARGLERMLHRQAYHDDLTDLPNRAAFVLALDSALEDLREDGPDAAPPREGRPGRDERSSRICLLLTDVDRFREINDFHGRDIGDAVLRATADLLRAGLGPGDLLARVGADEFAVLRVLPAPDRPAFPVGMPGETVPFHVGPVAVTTSGALVEGGRGTAAAELLADAEITLHAAKETGRPRSWRRYDPALRVALARVTERRSGLDRALAEEAFTLHYQPIVRLADRTLAAFESLIRWPQPDGTMMLPDEFIGLAETTGQIVPMGRWILRTATARAAAWNRERAAAGRRPVRVTVNVSAHELRAPAFPGTVADALSASGLAPDHLILEATESSLIDQADRAQATLRAVRAQGVRLALDDFGTGYSSLRYLRDLPVTGLKIDKGFTAQIGASDRQTALLEGIVGIGVALGLSIIAEGIETEEQFQRIREMGVGYGQGWLFGRPMTGEEADELVRTEP